MSLLASKIQHSPCRIYIARDATFGIVKGRSDRTVSSAMHNDIGTKVDVLQFAGRDIS
jgi:hypothetical protein